MQRVLTLGLVSHSSAVELDNLPLEFGNPGIGYLKEAEPLACVQRCVFPSRENRENDQESGKNNLHSSGCAFTL